MTCLQAKLYVRLPGVPDHTHANMVIYSTDSSCCYVMCQIYMPLPDAGVQHEGQLTRRMQ